MIGKAIWITLAAIVVSVGCNHDGKQNERPEIEIGISEQPKIKLMETASSKVRELGHKVEQLNFEIAKRKNQFIVSFFPKQEKLRERIVTFGGGITIVLNEAGEIESWEHDR